MGEMIGIRQQSGTIDAYAAVPQKSAHFSGGLIIAHELWGLTGQIMRTADRFAAQGFYVLAPDLFSSDKVKRRPSEQLQHELFSPNERVRYAAMPKLRAMIAPTQTPQFTLLAISKMESCFEYLYNHPLVHQKVAAIGYGLGGTHTISLAMREQRLRAAVSYYGHSPRITAELRHIKCPIIAFYGKQEKSLAREIQSTAAHMLQAGVDFNSIIYEGAGHAFFNDENGYAYNQTAAEDSWQRTLSFLHEHVGV